jgi:flagellar L-ring protein precursor FlgH
MKTLLKSFYKPLVVLLFCAAAGASPAQSLWKPTSRAITADKKAYKIGDTVTIIVSHSVTASKDNSTATSKKSSIDASISSFLYGPAANGLLTKKGTLPSISTSSANSFDGSGKINNNEAIADKITVTVVDVLPNGNMVVEGSRKTSFGGESQEAILRGVVRSDDLSSANTVYSYNLADATIKFIGKGTVSDNTKRGWFTTIWDKVNPF